jgi:hypothetical protein
LLQRKKKLESADIPYMVSGSIAANFYTTPRMTRDIDIVIQSRFRQQMRKEFILFFLTSFMRIKMQNGVKPKIYTLQKEEGLGLT